jgi:uncharacterized protein (UPF0332 family)
MTEKTESDFQVFKAICESIDHWKKIHSGIIYLYENGFLSEADYDEFCNLFQKSFSKTSHGDISLWIKKKNERRSLFTSNARTINI